MLEQLLPRIEGHGTVLCLAPLAPAEGVFCATAKDCYLMANAVEHPSFGLHLATAPLTASGETGHATFIVLNGRLDHIHLDEPGLLPLGTSGTVDHADMRRHLAAISYRNYATVVQRCLPAVDDDYALRAAAQAVAFAADHYLPVDTR
ncbi:TIM barrel protein [Zavarzinia sp.]|uniref:TIM barrel protein n=1 Tax=Zavarzinia sp. TaxID=2027920 RepID=UPI003562E376